MVSLHHYFHAFLDLGQHGVRIASEFGFADMERCHMMVGPCRPERQTSTVSGWEMPFCGGG